MALIKKIDVEEYFAARRAMRLGRKLRVSQPDATPIKPAGAAAELTEAPFQIPPGNNLLRALPPLRFQLCTIPARAPCSGRREAGKNRNQHETPAGLKQPAVSVHSSPENSKLA